MKLSQFLTLEALVLGLLVSSSVNASMLSVTIENLAPMDGHFLTPTWIGFHDGNFDIYDTGVAATPGLERLAEDGDSALLSDEFIASGSGFAHGIIAGPAGPIASSDGQGDSASPVTDLVVLFADVVNGSVFFSFASMVIPSNDAFIGNENPMAFEIFNSAGEFLGLDIIILGSSVLDAGTEFNDEIPSNTAFLDQMVPNTGVAEGGVVQGHPGFLPNGNILALFPGADFTEPDYQVARITIARVPEPETLHLLITGLIGMFFFRRARPRAGSGDR